MSIFHLTNSFVSWQETLYGTQILAGSGKTCFEFETDRGVIRVYEQHIHTWEKEEDCVYFEAIGQDSTNTYRILHDFSLTQFVDDHDIVYTIHTIRVSESTPLLDIRDHATRAKYIDHRINSIHELATRHSLDISSFGTCPLDELSSQDENEVQDSMDLTNSPKDSMEVELDILGWDEIATNMWNELHDRSKTVELSDALATALAQMEQAIETHHYDEAISQAERIRKHLAKCPYHDDIQDMVWRLDRPILKHDLSEVQTFEEMEQLATTHKFMRTTFIPCELLGEKARHGESHSNLLYVSRQVHGKIREIHSTLANLVDESSAHEYTDGKQLQLEVTTKRIMKSSYIPNQIIYKIRGFKNVDLIVDVW